MESVNELKVEINTKVMNFVLLTVVTGGIYPMMWLYLNQSKLTEIMNNQFIAKDYPLWLAIVTGLGWLLSDIGIVISDDMTILDQVANILSFASAVMIIVWAFKAKAALQAYTLKEFKFELKMNTFYTLLFNVYYIAYCVNSMESEYQKHKIIFSQDKDS